MRLPVLFLVALLAVGSCPSAVAQRAGAVGDRSWVDTSYLQPVNDRLSLRFTERLYLKEGDGAGSITRGDIDYSLGTDRILRFTSDVEYGQETDGAEWGSRFSYLLKISPRAALSYFFAVSGQTEPQHITDAYAIGVRYRRNVLRPWTIVEVEPSHLWRRETEDDRREPAWAISFRLELLEEILNRHHERRWSVPSRQAIIRCVITQSAGLLLGGRRLEMSA